MSKKKELTPKQVWGLVSKEIDKSIDIAITNLAHKNIDRMIEIDLDNYTKIAVNKLISKREGKGKYSKMSAKELVSICVDDIVDGDTYTNLVDKTVSSIITEHYDSEFERAEKIIIGNQKKFKRIKDRAARRGIARVNKKLGRDAYSIEIVSAKDDKAKNKKGTTKSQHKKAEFKVVNPEKITTQVPDDSTSNTSPQSPGDRVTRYLL